MSAKPCESCGATVCDTTDAFHALLRHHDLHPWCWSDPPDGWLGLIDRLVVDLKGMGWSGKVSQVKQKFGQLCFYGEELSDAMSARIDQAERESARTCETCGRPGIQTTVRHNWLACRCARHVGEGSRPGIQPLGGVIEATLAELGIVATGHAPVSYPPWLPMPERGELAMYAVPTGLAPALAWNLAYDWARSDRQGSVVVSNCHREDGAERWLALTSGTSWSTIVRHDLDEIQRQHIATTCAELSALPVFIDDSERLEWPTMFAHVEGLAAAVELGLVAFVMPLPRHDLEADEESLQARHDAEAVQFLDQALFLAESLRCAVVCLDTSQGSLLSRAVLEDEGLRGAIRTFALVQDDGTPNAVRVAESAAGRLERLT